MTSSYGKFREVPLTTLATRLQTLGQGASPAPTGLRPPGTKRATVKIQSQNIKNIKLSFYFKPGFIYRPH